MKTPYAAGFLILPAHNLNLRLDVPGGNRVNGQDLWVYNSNNTSTQRWRIIPNGDGSYRLMPMCAQHENMVMDIEGPSTAPSAPLQIWTWDDSAPQMRWYLERAETSTCIRNREYTRMPDDGFAQRWLDAMDGYNKFTPLETPLVATFLEHKIAIKLAINTIREQYPVASDMLDHYLDCSGEDYTISGPFLTGSSDIANYRAIVKNNIADSYMTLQAKKFTIEYALKEVFQITEDCPGYSDWKLAVNKCDLWATATANYSTYTHQYYIYMRDVYDYQSDSIYELDALGAVMQIGVNELARMSHFGLAKPYKVSGSSVF